MMNPELPLFEVTELPSAATFTARVARHFLSHPQEWIRATELEAIGGRQAWRTRVSDARRLYGLRIENRCRRITNADGTTWTLSEYRYQP